MQSCNQEISTKSYGTNANDNVISQENINEQHSLSLLLPIADSITYSLIDSIAPGTVLTQIIDDELLHVHNEINEPFFMTMYQKNQDVFYFAHQQSMTDAIKAFRRYRDHHHASHKFHGHLVTISDENKFVELASKTSPGYATKGGSWTDDFTEKNLNYFYEKRNGYVMLDKWKVRAAQGVDAQSRKWSCGPNSGLRSIYLLGESWKYGYNSFITNCPQWFSKDETVNNGAKTIGVGWGLSVVGAFLAPATGGLSLLPGLATQAVGFGTVATGAIAKCDVGPKPTDLAKYLSNKMSNYYAKKTPYDSQTKYELAIAKDIRCGYPRIVLLIEGTWAMHYINVVGFKPDGDYLSKVVLLDTDGSIGYMSDAQFYYWLDGSECAKFIMDKYTTIEFLKRK